MSLPTNIEAQQILDKIRELIWNCERSGKYPKCFKVDIKTQALLKSTNAYIRIDENNELLCFGVPMHIVDSIDGVTLETE